MPELRQQRAIGATAAQENTQLRRPRSQQRYATPVDNTGAQEEPHAE